MTGTPEPVVDGAAGRLVRPYAVAGGRTHPGTKLGMVSMVTATGHINPEQTRPGHQLILEFCEDAPRSIAEVAAAIGQPLVVTKILVSDLIEDGAMTIPAPVSSSDTLDPHGLLQDIIDGIKNL